MHSTSRALHLLLALTMLASTTPARAGDDENDDLAPLCPPTEQVQHVLACPEIGPGHYIEQLSAAGLTYPLPALPIEQVPAYRGLPHPYGRVVTDTAPIYRHPAEALAGVAPMRTWEKGFVFVSILGKVTYQGQSFYQINASEYMHAEDVKEVRPSGWGGAHLSGTGSRFGWVIRPAQTSPAPGAAPNPDSPWAQRYQTITPISTQHVGEWDWYELAPGQWAEQRNFGWVSPTPPAGVPADAIAVDTYEQTLAMYRGGQLVFATLISSGSRWFPTRPGTFQIWAKLWVGRMTGVYRDDRSDYYYLEDVPFILYYDGDRALHGAYWHDNFGVQTSHGCVNLSPADARWLYDNANIGDTVVIFSSR